eukprot:CAMPEP_0203821376 /NCGR_PEP_ID=MMETSP0115-20131106/42977_1 /ASSEMBLY_ACC=CAM_ASM_000227 /TAXON_ID=33651 /ORGANISM="Bicosoecid sp, Strain ms1" /LENGTH=166 /DNA_ID=CAMNT_0050730397 /DNA_START=23 /DNA_END=523 /DNA_ORIENTATION=-
MADARTYASCGHCGAHAKQQCSSCRAVRFCNADHAKAGWKAHKTVCKALKALQTSGEGWSKSVITEGSGEVVGTGAATKVHYVGTFANGTKFDSSRDRGRHFEFTPGQGRVIRAWDEGVATMKVGERATLFVSSDYGYGPEGAPPTIPGNSPLVFDVEVFEVASKK